MLKDQLIAISVSKAPDRLRLGLPAREFDRALLWIATAILRAGGRVLYAGNLDPDGFTFKLFQHCGVAQCASSEPGFVNLLPESELRGTSFDQIQRTLRECRGSTEIRLCVGAELIPLRLTGVGFRAGIGAGAVEFADANQFAAWRDNRPATAPAEALSDARRMATQLAAGRIGIGGKMGMLDEAEDRFEGAMPGVLEEAILSLEAGKPYLPLAAFGGATRDAAIALGLLEEDARVPRGRQQSGYAEALDRLTALSDRVPAALRSRLAALAANDRIEQAARDAITCLEDW